MNYGINFFLKSIATGLGLGLLPGLKGTYGSLLGLTILYFTHSWQQSILLFLFTFLGVISAMHFSAYSRKTDDSCIVIDEILGMTIAGFGFTSTKSLIIAFFLFRFLDIRKPYPISLLDQASKKYSPGSIQGAILVLADDVLAALITRVLTHFLN